MSHFAAFPNTFLKPCKHRVLNNDVSIDAYLEEKTPVTGTKGTPLCMLLTKEIGHTYGVTPKVCAYCQFKSEEPDEAFLARQKASGYVSMLELCQLGFYSEDDIENIIKRAYPFIKEDKKKKERFVAVLQSCLETGKLKLDRVEKIVQENMEDLINDSTGPIKTGGGTGSGETASKPDANI